MEHFRQVFREPILMSNKHSIEAEQQVLETIMQFAEHTNVRVQHAMLKLTTDCFYNSDNREIFRIIRECFTNHEPFYFVDILMLIPPDRQDLHATVSLMIENNRNSIQRKSQFESYVMRLFIYSIQRKQEILISRMDKEFKDCLCPEQSQTILSSALPEISALSYRESKHGVDYTEITEEFYDGKMADEIAIQTTCDQLNTALGGGIMPKSLIIAAAAPSVGKTSFSIFLMNAIASKFTDSQSLFFSIEMEYKHIWRRHVGIIAGKKFDDLSYEERMSAVTKLMPQSTKVYDAQTCINVADIDFILTTARLRAMEKPISVIVVDYLGLVESNKHYERNDLKQTDITTKLARLAIELNCIVIALSQINRGAANRAIDDRCPWPHDASDSSGGHKSASYWLGLDRPELYQDDACYYNQFVIKCRKNRFGSTFDLILAFNEGTFAEVAHDWFRKPMPKAKNVEEALFFNRRRDFDDN